MVPRILTDETVQFSEGVPQNKNKLLVLQVAVVAVSEIIMIHKVSEKMVTLAVKINVSRI